MDTKFSRLLQKPLHQITIKRLKWPLASVQNCDLGASPSRKVRTFKGDVTAADEDDAAWQRIQFEKLITCREVFFAGNIQTLWLGARGGQHVLGFEKVSSHPNAARSREGGCTVEGIHASFAKPLRFAGVQGR